MVFNDLMDASSLPIFTYGTLQIPEVMAAVTGHALVPHPAVLEGHHRALLRDKIYPGIVVREGVYVDGTLWTGGDEDCLLRLDAFEDGCYERRQVPVTFEDGSTGPAWAWVVPDHLEHLLSELPWDTERFRDQHLEDYLSWTR